MKRNRTKNECWVKRLSMLLLGLGLACGLTACEDDDDDFDHDIPAGQGTLVVNNKTFHDIEVFINGFEVSKVRDEDYEFYDRDPGVYRVVLDEDDGDRNWYGFVDVVEGKKSILDVKTASGSYNYDVYRRLE